MANAKSLQISESQVVGIMRLPEVANKPCSHEQKVSVWRLALAMIFMFSNAIVIIGQLNKPGEKK